MAMPDFNPEPIELRCESNGLHGVAQGASGTIEVKCRHCACTRGGANTYHLFDLTTGRILDTRRFKEPMRGQK